MNLAGTIKNVFQFGSTMNGFKDLGLILKRYLGLIIGNRSIINFGLNQYINVLLFTETN